MSSYKEKPLIPKDLILPEGMLPTEKQYRELFKLYKVLLNDYDNSATSHASMETLLMTEITLREHYQKEFNNLLDLHRTLPAGSLKVPERRPPPLIVGDKNTKLSPVVKGENLQ